MTKFGSFLTDNFFNLKALRLFVIFVLSILFCYWLKNTPYPIVIKRVKFIEPKNHTTVNFINCQTIRKPEKMSEIFLYSHKWLDDNMYYNSYVTLIQDLESDSKFYLLTDSILPMDLKMNFYFVFLNNGKFQCDSNFYEIIYPIYNIKRQISQ